MNVITLLFVFKKENQNSKSRGGRFDLPANELVERFNATITFEQRVCSFDIADSIAHATMLARQGIISKEDAEAICRGLEQVKAEIEAGQFVFSAKDEDIHMAIEKRMTEIVGPAGGRLHTGHSRNDQTTTSTKMCLRHEIREVQKAVRLFVDTAERHLDVIMPSYTHMQNGQPQNSTEVTLSTKKASAIPQTFKSPSILDKISQLLLTETTTQQSSSRPPMQAAKDSHT